MPQRIILHIGPPKTATTYLQHVLRANTRTLAAHGLSVIGSQHELRDVASDLLGRSPRADVPPRRGAWAAWRDRVLAERGDVVVSCERFSLLLEHHARTVVDAFAGADVQVVMTLRDPAGQLPSRWQERIKNGGTESWVDFCTLIADDPGFRERMLRMKPPLQAWAAVLPPERIKIVTVPEPGQARDLVRLRFAEALGLDADALVDTADQGVNERLGAAEAELVRRLNAHEEDGLLGSSPYRNEIRQYLVKHVLGKQPGGRRVMLSPAALAAARADTSALVARIEAASYPVYGALGDLERTPSLGLRGDIPETEVVAAAIEVIGRMSLNSYADRRRLRALQEEMQPRRSLVRRIRERVCA